MLYLPMYGISPSRHCCTSWWSSIGLQFQTQLSETGRFLPRHVTREFEDYLACGRLENGFLRVRCHSCSHEHLACTRGHKGGPVDSAAPTVGALGERGGFCTSCGARGMVETAALLVDHVLPHRPVRQWVLSFPYPLRFLLASQAQAMGKVLAIVNRAI